VDERPAGEGARDEGFRPINQCEKKTSCFSTAPQTRGEEKKNIEAD